MRKIFILAAFSAALAFALCACSLISHEPYRQTNYFDIVPDKAASHPDASYSALVVKSGMTFSDRMLFRLSGDRMEFDEYNRWLSTPDVVLRRYIELSYGPQEADKPSLMIKILRFELNKDAKTADVEVVASYAKGSDAPVCFRFAESGEAKTATAEDFASAMRQALAKVSDDIAKELVRQGASN